MFAIKFDDNDLQANYQKYFNVRLLELYYNYITQVEVNNFI